MEAWLPMVGLVEDIRRAAELLVQYRPFIAFTGAGISAESGVPTFRGRGGLWERFRPEELATPEAFERNPRLVWEWYRWRMEIIYKARPNPAHYALVELERLGLIRCVVTQNVDGLHQRAGQHCVVELHGNIWRARCMRCSYKLVFREPPREVPPRCPRCGGLLRPDVVWFGEPLPEEAWRTAVELAESSQGILVVGTSGVVMPAGYIPHIVKQHGGYVVEVNIEESAVTPIADVFLKGRAGEVLPRLVEEARKLLAHG
ncbi:NAD-dependent protein deacetylases, SIR2 family [Hyperthermus butylicus DSM 5456]|uniref:NAD-dependent protein deacylase n=2 Tax=Hyperthermus butylicus TaxID=54248 RepID=A2BMS1_HYPBU|nr:NAD-dependent protein deacetylase [Hyperthermus butylicus]ABM81282.1 NAD-dependent protein deacetylases, SIR2 family [Hyperthermus butylicus DSM 5456]